MGLSRIQQSSVSTGHPADCPGQADSTDAPFFVCGASRSGTTLFSLMMRGHPGIAFAGEMNFLFEHPISNEPASLAVFRHSLVCDRVFRATGYEFDDALGHADLIRSLIDKGRRGDRPVVVNLHRNFRRALEVYPSARFIHLLRDPRDVARSVIKMGWAGNVYFGVDEWVGVEKEFAALERLVAKGRVLTVRYGALIGDTGKTLSRVCEFLGVGYDQGLLSYTSWSTYSAPDSSLRQRWRRKLSQHEIGLIEGKAGAMMADRGIELSGYERVDPTRLEKFRLKLQNRAGRIRFSVRRYGLFWTFLEIFGRKLHLDRLAEYAQRHIDERMTVYLK